MPVTTAFCSICRREVHVAEGESLTCPVCSSPLAEKSHVGAEPRTLLPVEARLG